METASDKDVRNEGNAVFPYEEYKSAIEAESTVRHAGIKAVVQDAEPDENNPGCYLLGVKAIGTWDDGSLEEGTVVKDGLSVGDIVSADAEAGLVTVKGKASDMPCAGDEVFLTPPDYLQKLREFAAGLVDNPERRNEARFLELRETLLACPPIAEVKAPSMAHLREAQRRALAEAEVRDFSFVWGPPGTGKSYTLGHLAAHYRAQGKRVLLLSNTNAAVDTATFAIDNACVQIGRPLAEGELVRYTRVLTQKDEYAHRPHLMAFTKLLNRFAQMQRELDRKRVEAAKRLQKQKPDSDGYQEAFLKLAAINGQISRLADERKREVSSCLAKAKIVCCTVTSCLYNNFTAGNFDVVLVDEASLIPLAVWPCLLNAAGGKKFVVAGDPIQLAPVEARDPDIATHVWFDNNLYAHLGMSTPRGIAAFYECGAVTLLNEQTRMRKGIGRLVSNMFYNGLLTGDRDDARPEWQDSPLPGGDVALVDPTECGEVHGFERLPATYLKNTNTVSAGWVIDAVKRLVRTNPAGRKIDILVVTPFRYQALKIYQPRLKALSETNGVTVRVSTVHRCQGAEADIVFFDLVEPGCWFVNRPDAAHLWCVACSRAKHQLVFVGDRRQMACGRFSGQVLRQIEPQARRAC
jgi:hypothetical protein